MGSKVPFQGSRRRRHTVLSHREAALILGCGLLAACTRQPQVVIHAAKGLATVSVEVADTPDSRAHGLMYRNDLGADAGMLFIFPTEAQQSFWMKNTPLPLDMVFIGSNRHIAGIVADTRPFTTNPQGVTAPSQYVLEVHAGFCAKHGIGVGNAVDFARVPGTAN